MTVVSSRLPGLVAVSLGLEALLLLRRLPPLEVATTLAPGLFLVLAMRSGLANAGNRRVGSLLLLAGLAHLLDLKTRFGRRDNPR